MNLGHVWFRSRVMPLGAPPVCTESPLCTRTGDAVPGVWDFHPQHFQRREAGYARACPALVFSIPLGTPLFWDRDAAKTVQGAVFPGC